MFFVTTNLLLKMTLREYLSQNGLVLSRGHESQIGSMLSEKYRLTNSLTQVFSPEIGANVNDYPPQFLEESADIIIQFLTQKPTYDGNF